jgi:hypothetical protein
MTGALSLLVAAGGIGWLAELPATRLGSERNEASEEVTGTSTRCSDDADERPCAALPAVLAMDA